MPVGNAAAVKAGMSHQNGGKTQQPDIVFRQNRSVQER